MSGRDLEPISAFFPSIDRNLMLDLDRHFRKVSPSAGSEHPAPEAQSLGPDHVADAEAHIQEEPQLTEASTSRPSTSDVLEAVEQAAASMAAMDQRIQELEARHYELEATNTQLKTKLGELLQLQQAAEAKARAEAERAQRAEEIAARHLSRTQVLEGDLETALGDLNRIAEAITGSLGTLYRR